MSSFNIKKTVGKVLTGVLVTTLLITAVGGCAKDPTTGTTTAPAPVTLDVLAAASLTDAIKEINQVYTNARPWVTIVPNFASSGTLQVQIENGGACDVFISAAAAQMNNLQDKGLLVDGTRRNLLNNKVVLVVPNNSTLGLTSFSDLALSKVTSVAIGDPASVPAGTYAQQAFDLLGITDQVQPKYVMGADVRGVLAYVESGNIDAGIVYATDALTSDKVTVVASAPDEINSKIVYPMAITKNSKSQSEAQKYLDFLASDEAMAIFAKYGFSPAI